MKIISWNVNGLRAALKKDFEAIIKKLDADIICLQETKMEQGQATINLSDYEEYWNSAVKKGYSGTAVFIKEKPLDIIYGMGFEEYDQEGRIITLEIKDFYLVNVYVPNSQRELARLDYRMAWEDAFRSYVGKLKKIKAVIICGDLNVAHHEIDLKNPESNRKSAGFSDAERAKMTELLNSGFVDIFRFQNPGKENAYTWWTYRFKARENNIGWRIDYFLVSENYKDKIKEAIIYKNIIGSDHCPIGLIF